MKFLDCRRPSYFPKPLLIAYIIFCSENIGYRQKTDQTYSFLAPNFSGGTTPTFLRHIVSAIYCAPFGKIWLSNLSSVCWSSVCKAWQWSRMPNLRRVGKNSGPVLSRLPLPCGKVWLSSVVWSTWAKPGNEEKYKLFGRWVKMTIQFEAVCGPKFMSFSDDIRDPF